MELDTSRFDVIILGTGLIESLISAATARIGKSVLHLDSNDFYGGYTSSFNLEIFDGLMEEQLENIERKGKLDLCNCAKKIELKEEFLEIMKKSREFNIDLFPRIHFASGGEIDLLITSGVSRYLEFKCMESTYLYLEDDIRLIPSSKNDIFKSSYISLIEKRILSRFLNYIKSIVEEELDIESENESFMSLLDRHNLSSKLKSFVLYGILFLQSEKESQTISAGQAFNRIKKYVTSIGRYGSNPFLASLYGLSEFSQAFCRLSAVYGTLFMLNKTCGDFAIDDHKYKGISVDNRNIESDYLVCNEAYFPYDIDKTSKCVISRCVCIVTSSLSSDSNQLLIVVPPNVIANHDAIHIIQYSSEMSVCPKNYYLLHFTTKATKTAKEDLSPIVDKLLIPSKENLHKPKMIYCAYFNITSIDASSSPITNLFVCPDSPFSLDIEESVHKAQSIFAQIFPNEVFLPKAPDPEDLVWENTQENELSS